MSSCVTGSSNACHPTLPPPHVRSNRSCRIACFRPLQVPTKVGNRAAAKAGISERSARRIDTRQLQPSVGPRTWRTRSDPLIDVWDSVVIPFLEKNPATTTSVGIFDHLCEHHSDTFDPRSRRTLERRIRTWRQLHGPDQ